MRYRAFWLCLVAIPAFPVFAAEAEDREPPLSFYFEVEGGKRVPIELDKMFAPPSLGKTATLRLEPVRRFTYGGLDFTYPREYTFEAENEPNHSTWTLSGNDCKLMVQKFTGVGSGKKAVDGLHKLVVAGVRKAFGDAKSKEAPVKLEAGGKTLDGTRIEVELANTLLTQDLYPLVTRDGMIELIIQDAPRKPGEASPDRARAEGLLKETLKLPPAK